MSGVHEEGPTAAPLPPPGGLPTSLMRHARACLPTRRTAALAATLGPVDTGVGAGRSALKIAEPGHLRLRSRAARGAAALLAALAALLALPLQAQAQTAYVSNTGQSGATGINTTT